LLVVGLVAAVALAAVGVAGGVTGGGVPGGGVPTAVTGGGVPGGGVPTGPGRGASGSALARNRRAAHRDAAALLSKLRLPAVAVRLTAEPAGDHGWLKPMQALVATTAHADVHGWWQIPAAGGDVLAYLEARAPAGSKLGMTGGGSKPGSTEQDVSFQWPAIPGRLTSRQLAVSLTALPGGSTGVLAQAESEWIVPRPRSERVPASTREVVVTLAPRNGGLNRSDAVTSAGQVRRIVAMINALPVTQPVETSCPGMMVGVPLITFRFRASPGGAVLAQASYQDQFAGLSNQCDPITLTIAGRARHALLGDDFVRRVQRLTGFDLVGR
jgi:hypothetical protein